MSARKPSRRATARRPAPSPAPVAVPVSPRRLWSLLLWGGAVLASAGLLSWAIATDMPARGSESFAAASARAGFTVRQVSLKGNVRQDRLSIYAAVLEQETDALLMLDLGAMRARVEALPWVARASITRRWPDTLEVAIEERTPLAIWQLQGQLMVIDAAGDRLPVEDPRAFRHLPLVVGPGANREAAMLLAMVRAEPALAEAALAAIRVGERRWDLRLATGETLSLPEGEEAEKAFKRFARLERESPLRGQGFLRLDLRVPDRLVVRVSAEAQEQARKREREQARARAAAQAAAMAQPQVAEAAVDAPRTGAPT